MNMTSVSTCYRLGFDVLAFDGDKLTAVQKDLELEMRLKNRGVKDPEEPPDPEAGDRYIVVGALIGLVAGGLLGGLIGGSLTGAAGGVIGVLAGIIAGGIIGVKIGNAVKQKRRKDSRFGPQSYNYRK